MQPLKVRVAQYGTPEGIADNIRRAHSLGLPIIQPSICTHDGTWVIVGSGPSVRDHVEQIREESKTRPICGVKGGYDFCRENGITPAFYLSVEPRVRPVNLPHPETKYLLASRCDPAVFDALKGFPIYLWHAWGAQEENDLLTELGVMSFGGGPTSGLRAVTIGFILGFRKFRFYGMDSCLVHGEKRIGQGEIHNDIQTQDVIVNGRSFTCTLAMAHQAESFQEVYDFLPNITIESFGDGLLSAIIAARREAGLIA